MEGPATLSFSHQFISCVNLLNPRGLFHHFHYAEYLLNLFILCLPSSSGTSGTAGQVSFIFWFFFFLPWHKRFFMTQDGMPEGCDGGDYRQMGWKKCNNKRVYVSLKGFPPVARFLFTFSGTGDVDTLLSTVLQQRTKPCCALGVTKRRHLSSLACCKNPDF